MDDPGREKVYLYQPTPKWMASIGMLLAALVLLYAQPFPPFGLILGVSALIGFVLGFTAVAWHKLRCPNTLILTSDSLIIPKSSWSTRLTTVQFASIVSLEREKDPSSPLLGSIEYLHIVHAGGKVTIHGKWLSTQKDFDEIEEIIRSKLKAESR